MVAFLLKAGVVDTCMQCDGSFYWLGNQTRYQSKPAEDNTYILMDDTFKIHCQSAPHLAVANSHVKIVKLILSRAPETVHCTDFSGRTALHEAVRQDNVEIVEVPHKLDCQGATPLHVAACHENCGFIAWLLSLTTYLHIDIASKNQSTPLHSAAICKNNKDIKPLLDMGASIYATDRYGMTP